MNINSIIFGGNLTALPELKTLPSGSHVISFSLANNRTWKDANGQKQEQVEFGNCTLFGKQAEAFGKYAVKGQSFVVEGRLQTRSWEDKDTKKKMYRTEIFVERFHFGQKPLGAKTDAPASNQVPQEVQTAGYEGELNYGGEIKADDLPFN